MRSLGVVAAVVSLTVVSAAGGAAGKPVLRLVHAQPVVLAGTGFASAERVAVVYGTRKTVVRTTRAGTFRVGFATWFVRCAGAIAGASGPAGAAVLRIPPCAAGAPRLLYGFESSATVRGLNFVPFERVRISGRIGSSEFSSVGSADSTGRFSQPVSVPSERCAEVFVRATGALGSHASVTRPAPDCKAP